jgi:hypothetical protein
LLSSTSASSAPAAPLTAIDVSLADPGSGTVRSPRPAWPSLHRDVVVGGRDPVAGAPEGARSRSRVSVDGTFSGPTEAALTADSAAGSDEPAQSVAVDVEHCSIDEFAAARAVDNRLGEGLVAKLITRCRNDLLGAARRGTIS